MSVHSLQSAEHAIAFLRAHVSGTLHSDSRNIAPGDGFIAWPGAATDGRLHVADALARGAAACLVEAHDVQSLAASLGWAQHPLPIATLPQLKAHTGIIAAQWFGQPSAGHPTPLGVPLHRGAHAQLRVLAVTGTNGKTSTACWLAQALNMLSTDALSKQELLAQSGCAFVGTLGMGVPPHLHYTGMTTPDPVQLQRAFRTFADQGLGYCAIEASSIGIVEQRLAGTHICAALFTNFTQDHLDYHPSMDAYWQAKAQLFDTPALQAAIVNIDDAHGAQLHATLAQRCGLDLWSYALHGPARLRAHDICFSTQGLRFTVVESVGESAAQGHAQTLQTGLIGQYNIANLLGVIAALRSLGVPLEQAVAVCAHLQPIPGRMEQLAQSGQPLIAVDYAHTPDALEHALAALRPVAHARGGRVWCVFGCGGNRDRHKRPLMGAAVQHGAQHIIITNDNPRNEAPQTIIDGILQGMHSAPNVHVQPDRARAIAQAIDQADAADVILIAGKGHEDYQEIQGVRQPFSDMAQARAALAARGAKKSKESKEPPL